MQYSEHGESGRASVIACAHEWEGCRTFRLLPVRRTKTGKTAVPLRLYGHVQSAVVFVAQSDEAEGLQHASLPRPHGIQHFGHAVHIPRLSLKRNFDKVAFAQWLAQVQHSAGCRNGLQSAFGLIAIAQLYQGLRGRKLNSRSAVEGIDMGIMCHAEPTMALIRLWSEIT